MRKQIPKDRAGLRAIQQTQGPRPSNHYPRRAIQRAGKMANTALTSLLHAPTVDLERAHWLDISYWQEYIRPPDNTPYPIDGVFQRVAWGLFEDGFRKEIREDIDQANIPHACSYQYVRTITPMIEQAYRHLELREGMEYSGWMQDWERKGNVWDRNKIRDAYESYLLMGRETGQPGWAYFNVSFYYEYIEKYLSSAEIATLNIHWAQWWLNPSPLKNPGIPLPWGELCPWQYAATLDGHAYGVGSWGLDGDVWQETTEEVAAMFGDDPPPPPDDDQVEQNRLDIVELKESAFIQKEANKRQDKEIAELKDHNHDDIIDPPPVDGEKLFVIQCDKLHRVYEKTPAGTYNEWNVKITDVGGEGEGTLAVMALDNMVVRVLEPQSPGWFECEPVGMYKDGQVVKDNKGWKTGPERTGICKPGHLPRATVGLKDT